MKYFFNLLVILSLSACAVSDVPEKPITIKSGQLTLPNGQIMKWPFSDFDCSQCVVNEKQDYLPQGIEHDLFALTKNNKSLFIIKSKRPKKKVKDFFFNILNENEIEVCNQKNCQIIRPMKSLEFGSCQFIISNFYYEITGTDNVQDGDRTEFTVNGMCLN